MAYSAKQSAFLQSEFAVTKKIAEENNEWTTERIAQRQRWMAHQAKSIWKISQLSG